MKCPECNRKMIYNREIKDYYCLTCKSPLKEFKNKNKNGNKHSDMKSGTKNSDEDSTSTQTEPVTPPEIGAERGILFMMFGSLIVLIINPLICLEIFLLGVVIIFIGFFIVFKNRDKFSKGHRSNLNIALVLLVIWLIINFLFLFLPSIYFAEFTDQVEELDDENQTIPEDIVDDYVSALEMIIILSPIGFICYIIGRYFTIRNLIEQKYKILLTIAVPVMIATSFLNVYINLDTMGQISEQLKDQQVEEFLNDTTNFRPDIEQDTIMITVYQGISISFEVVLLLCYYWTFIRLKETEELKDGKELKNKGRNNFKDDIEPEDDEKIKVPKEIKKLKSDKKPKKPEKNKSPKEIKKSKKNKEK